MVSPAVVAGVDPASPFSQDELFGPAVAVSVAEDWQSAIDIVLRRFAEYHDLQSAFGRRALIERAKGILMERHAIDDAGAFEMLRERSRVNNRKLIDLATAVVDGHRLLPGQTEASPPP